MLLFTTVLEEEESFGALEKRPLVRHTEEEEEEEEDAKMQLIILYMYIYIFNLKTTANKGLLNTERVRENERETIRILKESRRCFSCLLQKKNLKK